ncbi:Adenylyl cyclase-associated protein, partial [Zea mays]
EPDSAAKAPGEASSTARAGHSSLHLRSLLTAAPPWGARPPAPAARSRSTRPRSAKPGELAETQSGKGEAGEATEQWGGGVAREPTVATSRPPANHDGAGREQPRKWARRPSHRSRGRGQDPRGVALPLDAKRHTI